MTQPLNFQSMILALHNYWSEQGCLIWHPYYSQVGAGTNNPATFLRVLGSVGLTDNSTDYAVQVSVPMRFDSPIY